jgi:O-antigen/teichoic acid export membrane protein
MILIELWNFLPAAICASLYPAIFNAKSGKSGSYEKRLQFTYDFLFWLGVTFAVSVSLLSEVVVTTLYGDKFPELPGLLRAAVWLGIFNFLSFGRIKYYALENRLREWVAYVSISFVVNFSLQMFLVPRNEELGAVVSMICSAPISLLICSCFSSFIRREMLLIVKCLSAPLRLVSGR